MSDKETFNMIQVIYKTIIGFGIFYYMFIVETVGLNFAVKINFVTAFIAPIIGYFMNNFFIYLDILETQSFVSVGFFTAIVISTVGYLVTLKAGIDREDCKEYKYLKSIVYSGRFVVVLMLTYIAVLLSPILQSPFVGLYSQFDNINPDLFVYIIVGIYMALISLSATIISYGDIKKEACFKDLKEYEEKLEKSKNP
jgi:hypothetical protein